VSEIWSKLIDIENHYNNKFTETGKLSLDYDFINESSKWTSRNWTSNNYRLANIVTADVRETKGVWMMHCCIFPHINDPSPIFGYDIVAGKNKITGFFHDFSSTGFPLHPLIEWFGKETKNLEWKKTRELPDWAKRIFSPHIIAASNVSEGLELNQIIDMGINNLDHYINCVGETKTTYIDNTGMQNIYCENQKLNPHNPRVMTNLGLDEEQISIFIEKCMFPEI